MLAAKGEVKEVGCCPRRVDTYAAPHRGSCSPERLSKPWVPSVRGSRIACRGELPRELAVQRLASPESRARQQLSFDPSGHQGPLPGATSKLRPGQEESLRSVRSGPSPAIAL